MTFIHQQKFDFKLFQLYLKHDKLFRLSKGLSFKLILT